MKFRVRSIATKETLRIEAPDPCSLHHLKTLVAGALSASIPPGSIRLSLNRKDELLPSSAAAAADSLDSLGLASGDLIYFSLAPDSQTLAASVSSAPPPEPTLQGSDRLEDLGIMDDAPVSLDAQTLIRSSSSVPCSDGVAENSDIGSVSHLDNPSAMDLELNPPEREQMEIDALVGKSLPVPCFLKRVMEAEKGEDEGILGRLVITIHTVFLESGLVVRDGAGGDASRLPEGWASKTSNFSIQYILPELSGAKDAKAATLRILALGSFVTVYGFLSGDHPDVYRLCFDLVKLAPLLSSPMDCLGEQEEKEVFELWKIVKDGLSLPLLIDICQKNGLPSPTCFMLLPTDIKMRILEFLTGSDVASIGCTCSELRYLSSNDDLWKKKFLDVFGLVDQKFVVGRGWKDKYVNSLSRKRACTPRMPNVFTPRFTSFGPRRFPVAGGYIDVLPVIGGGHAPAGRDHRNLVNRRSFSPLCILGRNSSFLQ